MSVPSTLRHGIVLLLALGALLVASAGAVWACTPSAEIQIRPVSGEAGSHVTVYGARFSQQSPGETVVVTWQAADGQVLAEAQGSEFTVGLRIPDASPGTYAIVARNPVSGAQHSRSFTVTAPAPDPVVQPPDSPSETVDDPEGEPPASVGDGAGGVPAESAPPADTGAALPPTDDQAAPAQPEVPGSPANAAPPAEQAPSGSQPGAGNPPASSAPGEDAARAPLSAQPAPVGAQPADAVGARGAEDGVRRVTAPRAPGADQAAASSESSQSSEDAAQPRSVEAPEQHSPAADGLSLLLRGTPETISSSPSPSTRSVGADLWSGFAAEPAPARGAGVTDDRPRSAGTVPVAAVLGVGLLVLLAGSGLLVVRRKAALARSRIE